MNRIAIAALLAAGIVTLLFGLLGADLSGLATFQVEVLVDSVDIDFSSYQQLSSASPGNVSVLLSAPVTYQFSGSLNATEPIDNSFLNASNFTMNEDGVNLSTTRTGDALYWSADSSANATLYFLVPAPNLTVVSESDGASYVKSLRVFAQTPLRSADFTVSVSPGYEVYSLVETTGSETVRTSDYALSVSGSVASFSDVAFSQGVLERTLEIRAVDDLEEEGEEPALWSGGFRNSSTGSEEESVDDSGGSQVIYDVSFSDVSLSVDGDELVVEGVLSSDEDQPEVTFRSEDASGAVLWQSSRALTLDNQNSFREVFSREEVGLAAARLCYEFRDLGDCLSIEPVQEQEPSPVLTSESPGLGVRGVLIVLALIAVVLAVLFHERSSSRKVSGR